MYWYWIGVGVFVLIAVCVLVWAAVVVGGRTDDWLDERDGGNRGT